MDCPRCKVAMAEVRVVDIPVDLCPNCDGTWYDAGELGELLDTPIMDLHVSPLAPAMLPDKAAPSNEEALPCPRCGQVMERYCYLQRSTVQVDGCPEHGIWLDDGELPRILEFVNSQPRLPHAEPPPPPKKTLARALLGLLYDFGDDG